MSSEPREKQAAPPLTNETVLAMMTLYLRQCGDALSPNLPGSPVPAPPEVTGFAPGWMDIDRAQGLCQSLIDCFAFEIQAELARAENVSHLPADKARQAIQERMIRRRDEMATGKRLEHHLEWFRNRHRAALEMALRTILGPEIRLVFHPSGVVAKIEKPV